MAKFLDLTGLTSFTGKIKAWATGAFVAKESGKGLSSNDYTTTEKQKLATLEPLTIKVVKVNGSALSPDGSKAVNIDLSTYALKTAVTQEIAQAVSGIKGFEAKVVAELPGSGQAGILYLVANEDEEEQNAYDEYLWINNKYEKLGTRSIDLSQYALKSELPTKVSQLTNDSGFQTSVQVGAIVDGKIVNKVDKVSGKQLSTEDYTTAEKQKLAGLTNYTHPTSDGNKHVPANGTTNAGKVLTAGSAAGVYTWENIPEPTAITEDEIEQLWNEAV